MPDDRFLHPRWQAIGPPPAKRERWAAWRWDHCPTVPGLYAIYERGALVYIGSSVNLRVRLRAHLTRRHWARETLWIKIAPMLDGWRERERRIVARLRPRDNRQWAHAPGHGALRAGFW